MIACVLVAVGVVFGVQAVTKTGVFRVPGRVYYGEELSEGEVAEISRVLEAEDVVLDKDVYVSANEYLEMPELSVGDFLTSVEVPVTGFYSVESNVNAGEVSALRSGANRGGYELIDVLSLDFTKHLLRVNDAYYLDDFKSGAVFRVVTITSEKYDEVEPLIAGLFDKNYPTSGEVLTLAQTGVTALSRRMNTKLSQVGSAEYFAENIGEWLSSYDLTHTSNEASFTDAANGSNICSNPEFINTLTAIGLDIVELTGNHNLDCGVAAAEGTLEMYAARGIKTVGGGVNATDAAVPLEINEKGTKITFLAFNESTGGATTGDYPGANQYYEEVARAQIAEAKARGDFVIVDVQYYECNDYDHEEEWTTCDVADSAAGDQVGLFRGLIDMGADVVVGTSAHQPQTYELYGDGAIYYGLGNLFFDQYWWPGTTRSLVLVHHFYKGKLLQTEIRPTVYDSAMQTRLMDEEGAKWYLSRLQNSRP